MIGPLCAAFASASAAPRPSLGPVNGAVAMVVLLLPPVYVAAVRRVVPLLLHGKHPISGDDCADRALPFAAVQALAPVNNLHELRHCRDLGPPH